MKSFTLSCFAILCCTVLTHAQSAQHLGWSVQPSDSEPVAGLQDYGEWNDMTGGIQVGEIAPNFTVYDPEGVPYTLSENLEPGKYTILMSGSVSCLRFRNAFDLTQTQTEAYVSTHAFMADHLDDFNWALVYGIEAHPTDGNCPSNCPTTTSNDTTVLQPLTYFERRWAVKTWDQAEEFIHPIDIYADNPDNGIYNTFFERPFGICVLDCTGEVVMRGDWAMNFFHEEGDLLMALHDEGLNPCAEEEEPSDPGLMDSLTDQDATQVRGFDFDVADLTKSEVYPNPIKDVVNVSLKSTNKTKVEVWNVAGQIMTSEIITNGSTSINSSLWDTGIYFVRLSSGDQVETRRILKD